MWILIVMAWNACGLTNYSPATSLTNVPGFATLDDCVAAGKLAAIGLHQMKVQYACVSQPR